MNIAIIPARGASKRIPKKNIIDFMGKPMIAWTIEAALESRIFDKVVVSTDSQEIADIAIKLGAEVPFLRTEFADDITPVSMVTVAMLEQMKITLNLKYDVVVQLMANCPLRRSDQIVDSYHHFISKGFEFQISCCQFGWLNPWWAFQIDLEHKSAPLFPEALKKRSQDMPPLFCPTGAIWIARTDSLLRDKTFYGQNHRFFPIDWRSGVDIDDLSDLTLAKCIVKDIEAERPNHENRS